MPRHQAQPGGKAAQGACLDDLQQSDSLDEQAFLQLVRAAVNLNRGDAKG